MEGRDGTTHNQHGTLEVIRLAIAQEVANNDNGQDKQDNHEDFKVEVHVLVHGPADQNDKRGVEQGRLDRGADAVEEGKVLYWLC